MDYFGQPFNFVLPDHSTKLRSIPGAICWLALMTYIIGFAAYRFSLVFNLNQYYTIEEKFEYHFDDTSKVSLKNNQFAVAARITDFSLETNGVRSRTRPTGRCSSG